MKTLEAALPAVDLVGDVRAGRRTLAGRNRRTHRHADRRESSSRPVAHRSPPAGAAEVRQRGSHQGSLSRPERTPVYGNARARYAPCAPAHAKGSRVHGRRYPDAGARDRREHRHLRRDRQHLDQAARRIRTRRPWSASGTRRRGCPGSLAASAVLPPCTSRIARRTGPFNSSDCGSSSGASVTGVAEPEMPRALFVTYGRAGCRGREASAGPLVFAGGRHAGLGRDGHAHLRLLAAPLRRATPSIVGRTLTIDSKPHTVIGVMPEEFRFQRDPGADSSSAVRTQRAVSGTLRLPGVLRGSNPASRSSRPTPMWLACWESG